jgi:hypothetical protein
MDSMAWRVFDFAGAGPALAWFALLKRSARWLIAAWTTYGPGFPG